MHHAQMFELMFEGVVADAQPQTEEEWKECLEAVQEAKNSLLSVAGVSPMQIASRRNPEVPGDDSSDVVAKSSILHDRGAGQSARVRTIARTKSMLHADKMNARKALDTRMTKGGGTRKTSSSPMAVWNLYGRGAMQLLDRLARQRDYGLAGAACGKLTGTPRGASSRSPTGDETGGLR